MVENELNWKISGMEWMVGSPNNMFPESSISDFDSVILRFTIWRKYATFVVVAVVVSVLAAFVVIFWLGN